eukprot:359097-Chlamydomonas_euryale.AAC.1
MDLSAACRPLHHTRYAMVQRAQRARMCCPAPWVSMQRAVVCATSSMPTTPPQWCVLPSGSRHGAMKQSAQPMTRPACVVCCVNPTRAPCRGSSQGAA